MSEDIIGHYGSHPSDHMINLTSSTGVFNIPMALVLMPPTGDLVLHMNGITAKRIIVKFKDGTEYTFTKETFENILLDYIDRWSEVC